MAVFHKRFSAKTAFFVPFQGDISGVFRQEITRPLVAGAKRPRSYNKGARNALSGRY